MDNIQYYRLLTLSKGGGTMPKKGTKKPKSKKGY